MALQSIPHLLYPSHPPSPPPHQPQIKHSFQLNNKHHHLLPLVLSTFLPPSLSHSLSFSLPSILLNSIFIMSRSSREINVPRLAPLKNDKDSHKQSSSSSSSTTTSSTTHHRHDPVIIYTDSPKIIHTLARDFMALVQKLTGLPHSTDDDDSAAATNDPPPAPSNIPLKDADTMHAANNDSSSSSVWPRAPGWRKAQANAR